MVGTLFYNEHRLSLKDALEAFIPRVREKHGPGTISVGVRSSDIDTVSTKYGDVSVFVEGKIRAENDLWICVEDSCPRCGNSVGEVLWGSTDCPNCGLHFECC